MTSASAQVCPQCEHAKSRILSSMPKKGDIRQRKHYCRNCGFDFHSHEDVTTGEVCLAVYAGNHRGWVVDRDAPVASFDAQLAVEGGE